MTKYKFQIGQRVRVREDLEIGEAYFSEVSEAHNYFNYDMNATKGHVAEIIGRTRGQYILSLNTKVLYVDSMLEDPTEEDDAEFAKADYVYDANVEELMDTIMYDQAVRAMDHALENRLYETNPEQFNDLYVLMNQIGKRSTGQNS